MAVLLPIQGIVAMLTITGLVYHQQNMGNQTFDYAMIDGDAVDCVIFTDDNGDYVDFAHEGETVQNVTTLNVTHLDEEVILRALQIIEFERPFSYLNLTDDQAKELIKDGHVDVTEAEITMPEVVAGVIGKGRNDTGSAEVPSVVLVIKEDERCLIIVKDQENDSDDE